MYMYLTEVEQDAATQENAMLQVNMLDYNYKAAA